jgi:protein-serine/threonine kinase
MGGVSNPTNFTHRVHVGYDPHTGGFVGLPAEWEKLLSASAITKEDYQKHPEAVMEALNFYTEKLMKRAEEPVSYPSPTPTPPVETNKQLGYTGTGTSIAPPRQTPSTAFQRNESFQSNRSDTYPQTNDRAAQIQAERDARDAQARADAERQRRMDEEIRRKREQQQRDQERQRERDEQAAYNASLPKSRPPMAQQELSGYSDDKDPSRMQPDRYNPSRPVPASSAGRTPQQMPQSLRQNLQAQRPAPSAPMANGRQPTSISKPQSISSTRQQPSQKYPSTNGVPTVRPPQNGVSQQSKIPAAATAPKPLNVQTKQPTGVVTQTDAVKKAEQALTRKDDGGGRKEVRMSSMSEAEVMAKLREVVSKERPLDSYNKQKKIGQGASGSVYVARIRENATSGMARRILREQGPKAQVAIKQMDLRNQPRKELIVNEIIVMKESRHENIVNFLDAFLQEESSELWVVMEFMEGGALTDVIDNNPEIREDQIATVSLEVSLSRFHFVIQN